MHKIRFLTGGALFVALIAGFGYATLTERPISQIPVASTSTQPTTEQPTTSSTNPSAYSLAQVAQHNTVNDCWAAIEGTVYDLTTWVTRHPGGPETIAELCGTDGTASFRAQHNNSRAARAALVLLKIGTLQ